MTVVVTKYNVLARIFHWGGALMIALAWASLELFDDVLGDFSWQVHKMTGLSFLLWTILRLANIVVSKRPALPPMPHWQIIATRVVHISLYVCMFAMPILGILLEQASGRTVSFFGIFALPNMLAPDAHLAHTLEEWHKDVVFSGLLALIGAHAAGALYHQFIMKDHLLARMR